MKLRMSVIGASVSGAAGNVVAASWKGIQYIRELVIPHNPKSVAQTSQRDAFARCVDCYQWLPVDVKAFLDKLGNDCSRSGFNVMMSDSVKTERADRKHRIMPTNRYAEPLVDFVAASGVAPETIKVTWSAEAYIAEDTFDLYVRNQPDTGEVSPDHWTQIDTSAANMTTETFEFASIGPTSFHVVAMFPYDTSAAAFGGGDCAADVQASSA